MESRFSLRIGCQVYHPRWVRKGVERRRAAFDTRPKATIIGGVSAYP